MRTIYKAVDGKMFKNSDECKRYENSILNLDNMKQAIEFIRGYCDSIKDCDDCPFFDQEYQECRLTSTRGVNTWNIDLIDEL